MAQILARGRWQRTPARTAGGARGKSIDTSASAAMWISPPSTNGAAEMPAISQNRLCMRSSTNAASGRLEASTLINLLHHLRVDVDRELAARVVDDPHMEHRGHAHIDRPDGTCGCRCHQAELEPDWRDADVLMLVPRRERAAGVGAELADSLHLKHRAEQHRAMFAVRVDESLRMPGVHHIARMELARVNHMGGRHVFRPPGPVSRRPRVVPIAIWSDRRERFVVEPLCRGNLLWRRNVVRRLQEGARMSMLGVGPGQAA